MKYISQKQLETKLEPIDFKSLSRKESNARLRIRFLSMSHIRDGANRAETAKYLKINRRMVNDWAKRFFNGGIEVRDWKHITEVSLNPENKAA